MCPYAYYTSNEIYNREVIWCKITNKLCGYIRYCNRLDKIIPSDSMEECLIKNKEKKIEVSKGASKVIKNFSNEKKLYVEIENNGDTLSYKISNPFDYIPDYVYLEKKSDGYKVKENKD